MVENPIKFVDDAERVEACHNRNKEWSELREVVEALVVTHRNVKSKRLCDADFMILDNIMQTVISDIFHKDAEDIFLFEAEAGEYA